MQPLIVQQPQIVRGTIVQFNNANYVRVPVGGNYQYYPLNQQAISLLNLFNIIFGATVTVNLTQFRARNICPRVLNLSNHNYVSGVYRRVVVSANRNPVRLTPNRVRMVSPNVRRNNRSRNIFSPGLGGGSRVRKGGGRSRF